MLANDIRVLFWKAPAERHVPELRACVLGGHWRKAPATNKSKRCERV